MCQNIKSGFQIFLCNWSDLLMQGMEMESEIAMCLCKSEAVWAFGGVLCKLCPALPCPAQLNMMGLMGPSCEARDRTWKMALGSLCTFLLPASCLPEGRWPSANIPKALQSAHCPPDFSPQNCSFLRPSSLGIHISSCKESGLLLAGYLLKGGLCKSIPFSWKSFNLVSVSKFPESEGERLVQNCHPWQLDPFPCCSPACAGQ